jgi:hypothetical protein
LATKRTILVSEPRVLNIYRSVFADFVKDCATSARNAVSAWPDGVQYTVDPPCEAMYTNVIGNFAVHAGERSAHSTGEVDRWDTAKWPRELSIEWSDLPFRVFFSFC